MNPSLIISLIVIASILGAVGYSYHVGREQGQQVCEAEKLASQLKQTREELKILQDMTEFQQKQVGEAQEFIDQERAKSEKLQQKLDELNLSTSTECIPDSVLEQLHEFRRNPRDKNSKSPFGS